MDKGELSKLNDIKKSMISFDMIHGGTCIIFYKHELFPVLNFPVVNFQPLRIYLVTSHYHFSPVNQYLESL